jgi:hypothetical protein
MDCLVGMGFGARRLAGVQEGTLSGGPVAAGTGRGSRVCG